MSWLEIVDINRRNLVTNIHNIPATTKLPESVTPPWAVNSPKSVTSSKTIKPSKSIAHNGTKVTRSRRVLKKTKRYIEQYWNMLVSAFSCVPKRRVSNFTWTLDVNWKRCSVIGLHHLMPSLNLNTSLITLATSLITFHLKVLCYLQSEKVWVAVLQN